MPRNVFSKKSTGRYTFKIRDQKNKIPSGLQYSGRFLKICLRIMHMFKHRPSGDDIIIWKLWEEKDESSMIMKFVEYLSKIPWNSSIYGYNCLKFDIPFITARLSLSGLMDGRIHDVIHNKKWFDLYQFQGDYYVSMDRWCRVYGIERSCPYSGEDVPLLYKQGKYNSIVEHAVDDLVLCELLFTKLMQ